MNHKLIEDIKLAIGNRSYSQVTSITGISKPTLSRLVQQSQKRTVNPKLLWKLSSNAQNSITFELLMADAGFTEAETRVYRTQFERESATDTSDDELFSRNAIITLLSLLDSENLSFSHEIIRIDGMVAVLTIHTSANYKDRIYVIDGMPEKGVNNQERRQCEMIGRCFLIKKASNAKICLVTSVASRYSSVEISPLFFADEIILTDQSGNTILEKKGTI